MIKLKRCDKNPILTTVADHPWESVHVSNAGAALKDGKVHIFYRAEGADFRASTGFTWPVSRIGHAVSSDGVTIDERCPTPVIDLDGEQMPETDGVEDVRVSEIDGTYYAVYCTTTVYPETLALATSPDLIHFEKHGTLMPDYSQRTGGLLPAKVDGEFVLYHRVLPHLWASKSKDLKNWHDSKVVMHTRPGHWTEIKMGIGAPPIKTDQAWVMFMHGRDRHGVYRLGIMWLDLEDPTKVLKFQEEPILEPETDYEKNGFVPNVVYTCGAVVLGEDVFVYYGCADNCLAVATVPYNSLRL
ncbi:MAG: glycosidase [Armatimonadota bacterium]